ncbi:MAG: cryptochrome/photolyase family protein [Alphaproteobacteria bacterium]
MPTTLLWFRHDLRLADNPALHQAITLGQPCIALYLLPQGTQERPHGAASRWWLHHSLTCLKQSLSTLNIPLILSHQPAQAFIQQLCEQYNISHIFWNRSYELAAIERDRTLKIILKQQGINAQSFNSHLLYEPWEITNQQGSHFKVFTPFWKKYLSMPAPALPLPLPTSPLPPCPHNINTKSLTSWQLLPQKPDWAAGLRATWHAGEQQALQRLHHFLDHHINNYHEGRNRPDLQHVSGLSPHLRFGEISPRQIWHATQNHPLYPQRKTDADSFLRELGWREFCYHLLFQYPNMATNPLDEKFNAMPWAPNPQQLTAWQQGKTGIPLIDAGMRQLWHTGWMHNRVRMVVASFLIKNLLIPWQEGEQWFWDTLVDADPANNSAGWQWVAGCGADAAPYFRVFNPILQSQKFDPEGNYIRQYVPELAKLPNNYIHEPHTAPPLILHNAGIRLGITYPNPLVDLKKSRDQALQAYDNIKKRTA